MASIKSVSLSIWTRVAIDANDSLISAESLATTDKPLAAASHPTNEYVSKREGITKQLCSSINFTTFPLSWCAKKVTVGPEIDLQYLA
jgi:hypothetical protein